MLSSTSKSKCHHININDERELEVIKMGGCLTAIWQPITWRYDEPTSETSRIQNTILEIMDNVQHICGPIINPSVATLSGGMQFATYFTKIRKFVPTKLTSAVGTRNWQLHGSTGTCHSVMECRMRNLKKHSLTCWQSLHQTLWCRILLRTKPIVALQRHWSLLCLHPHKERR
jgi:hypothetical protein